MNNLYELPPFYVGQEIVANCNYIKQGITFFKKGDEFVVKQIKKACCLWVVDIGLINPNELMICSSCKRIYSTKVMLFKSSRFSSKIKISEFISMKQVVEQGLELVGAN